MKYKTRLVFLSVLVVLLLIAASGIIVTGGIFRYIFNNSLQSAYMVSEDTNVFINQSVGATRNPDRVPVLYSSSAEYYAQRVASLYSVDVILYDTSFNVVGTNFADAEIIEYKAYASKVYETGKASYIFTDIGGISHVILFSNLRLSDTVYGVSAVIKSLSTADSLMRQTGRMFVYAGIFAVVLCIFFFNGIFKKMLLPVKQLTEYNKNIVSSEEIIPPDVDYIYDDEMMELIVSAENMAGKIGEKINELSVQGEKFGTVVSAMEDGIIMVGESGEVILTNRKADTFLGGNDYREVIPSVETHLQEVFSKARAVRTEFEYDGRNYVCSIAPVSGEQREAVIALSDITSFKALESEQNKFISSVSHELKTPLTTIIGYIDLLQRRGTDDKRLTDKALEVMKSESKRLLRLVNDLLNINTYSRLDFDFIFTDVNMNDILEEATQEMSIKAEAENKVIIYNSMALPVVSGDYDRLKQVILNVLDNALKYSHEQDIIKVTATYYDDILEITVRDYGEGIPENVRSKVFDAFYRVGDDRSRLSGGFGLGLSIVKHIIQKHSGDVEIDSVLGQGTLVTIRLPIKKDENAQPEEGYEEMTEEEYEEETL